jgi:hypothetical protein
VAASGTSRKISSSHRLVVGRVEGDGLLHAHHGGQRVLQALDAAVRDGHRMAQAGGAQALAGKQVVGDGAARDGVLVLEQQARLFEHPLLAGRVHVHQHVAGGRIAARRFIEHSPARLPDRQATRSKLLQKRKS